MSTQAEFCFTSLIQGTNFVRLGKTMFWNDVLLRKQCYRTKKNNMSNVKIEKKDKNRKIRRKKNIIEI